MKWKLIGAFTLLLYLVMSTWFMIPIRMPKNKITAFFFLIVSSSLLWNFKIKKEKEKENNEGCWVNRSLKNSIGHAFTTLFFYLIHKWLSTNYLFFHTCLKMHKLFFFRKFSLKLTLFSLVHCGLNTIRNLLTS